MTTQDNHNNNYFNSPTYKKDCRYWSKFVLDSRNYIKFYNINEFGYNSKRIDMNRTALFDFLKQENCSLFEFYGSVFALYLARINRQDGCLLKTSLPPVDPEESAVSTLLRIVLDKKSSFRDLLKSFQSAFNQAAAHTKIDVENYLANNHLDEKITFYHIYDFSGTSYVLDPSRICNDDESASISDIDNRGMKHTGLNFALTLNIYNDSLELLYNTDIFSKVYIDHMVKNIESLAESVLSSPAQIITDIDILSKEEKDLISEFSSGRDIAVDETRVLSQALRDYAIANPDAVAIDDGVTAISYGQLEKSSNSLADDLYKNHHVRPGSRVALMLPRDYRFPEMVLALNKLGAAYIPIDTQFPANRIGHMISIAQAEHFIVAKSLGETLDLNTHMIYVEDLDPSNDVDVDIRSKADDLLAIFFTSGTTGIPKGVMITSRQISWGIISFDQLFHFSTGDLVGLYFSFSFVGSLIMYAAFYMGSTLRLFNEEEQKNSLLLLKAFKENHINSVILPPAVGIPLYENEDLNLDYLLLAGAKLHELSKKERHTKLINAYGTTEVILAISKEINLKEIEDDRVPLGKPIANTYAYILDADGHQMPVGVPGEICISGGICSSGYYNDPELTSRCFVDNPFSDRAISRKMYRTGDIGFYNFDGEIEIIGREDNQLSVRGFRIESNEILGIIKRFPQIWDIYLDVENDNLTAYYTAAEGLDIHQIKESLARELPHYMIPSLFIKLEKIPLNINGKIDKSGLRRVIAQEDIEITDEILRSVMDVFKEVLHLDVVLMDDDFVSLGGNSLSAMRLQLSLREKIGVSLSSNDLIGLSTPKDIANYIKYNLNVYTVADENRYSFDEPCPLSESQLNVYLDERVHDMGTGYNNPFIIRFKEKKYSAEEIKNALIRLFDVFPVLKGRILNREDSLAMVFDAEPQIALSGAEGLAGFVKRFELDKSLSRFLITEENGSTILCADLHHLIFDGASLNVFLKAFLSLLNGSDIDYVDTGALREVSFEEIVYSGNIDEASAFFEGMLADKDEVYDLIPSLDADDRSEYIDTFDMDMEELSSFLRSHSMTHNQFFAGVFAYTLSRFSGSEKVFFNLIEDGRGHIDLSRSVGMFVKTLPVLMDCKNQDLDSFLAYASDLINSVMKYDLYPFRILAGKYDLNANIMFQYSHDLFAGAVKNDGLDYAIEELEHDLNAAFSFDIFNSGDGRLTIRTQGSSLYGRDFLCRFARSYKMILRGMMEAERLGDIPYISKEDLVFLDRFNQTEAPIRHTDILDAFNDSLSKYPDNKLVVYGDVSYTFAQGAYIGNKIRRKLLALSSDVQGSLRSQDMIGFLVPRSELYMFCVLGIMSAGAAYVPIDETLPDERIRFMIKDTGSRVLIVSDDTLKRAESLAIPGLILFNISDIMKEATGTLEHLPVQYGNLACILYTSGSSGLPKGVKITRKSVLYFTDFNANYLGLRPGDVYGFYTSVGFDVSVEALFSSMYSGACMDVVPECVRLDIQALNRHFLEHNVTYIDITTQVAKMFISQVEETSLKILLTGGEKLGPVNDVRPYRIVDSYGPTEAIDYVTLIDIRDRIDPSSIGYPNKNTKAYVLDKELRRVPVGAVGELYFSGPQLADGYLNREEETARLFIKNPFEENEEYGKLYSTGDVVRVLPDGTYGIIGRRDGQVKVRGNRLELTAVDSIIRKMDVVKDVTTRVINKNGNNELVAYVVSEDLDEKALFDTVSEYLSGRVPAYMVPSYVIKLDQIPLNVNGKVDKRALPDVDISKLHTEYAAPESELERIIVSGFEKVFNLDHIGVNDDFVRLGGDSLTAVRLLSIIGNYGISLSANDLIGLSTPKNIADHIKDHLNIHTGADENRYSFDEPCPLSESQLNVYLDESVHDMGTGYNSPFIIRFKKNKYSPEEIKNALVKLFDVFPVLKGRVLIRDESLSLAFDAEPAITFAGRESIKTFVRKFDLNKGLCRFLITEEKGSTILCADIHHLIFDGTSLNVFTKAFLSLLNGSAIDFVDTGMLREVSFEETVYPRTKDEAGAFFDGMLADKDEVYDLIPSLDADDRSEYIDTFDMDMEELSSFLRSHSMTYNQFFAGVFAYTLSRFSGSEKVFFNLIEDGRGHIDLSRSVGMFVKTLPVLMDCKNQDLDSFLAYSSKLINSVMKYDLYPFRILAGKYDLSANIMFQYSHDLYAGAVKNDGLDYEIEELDHDLSADFSFDVLNNGDGRLTIRTVGSSLYGWDFIHRFAQSYKMILRGMMEAERLGDIPYISKDDLAFLDKYNQTEAPVAQSDILDVFNDTLSKYPDNKLVEFGDVSYTFAQGAYIGNEIRQKLLALRSDSHGSLRSQDKIGFLVPRSELYMFCILGIMSAGAAYIPLDDTLPDERIRFMIKDTRSRVLIVSDDTLKRAESLAIPGLILFNISDIMKEETGTLEHLPLQYGDLACILYTSGSTNIPKGVKITRKSLLYLIDFHVNDMGILPGDVYSLYCSIGFDVSMISLFSTMYSGACMDVIPECIRLDIQAMNRHFIEHNTTHAFLTTQIAKLFVSQVEESSLKTLVMAGEKLGQVSEVRNYRMVDAYGPTEACAYVTSIDLSDKIDPSSVGYANDNTRVYVLDKEQRRVPVGAVGEIYLSGPQLADGYLNREEETAQAFISNPFEDNEEYGKIYSTGDVARVLPDGTYGIIGRRDGQVKVRGNRVELTAVDSIIRTMDAVKDVTTKIIHKNGNNELVAYVVSDVLDEQALPDAVSEYLSSRVPAYMIPSFVIKMDKIPLNVNGKVDKRALPDVDFSKLHAEYAAPVSELEKIIVKGFERVFNLDKISVNDDFIRLGGDSLTAVRLLSLIGDYGITIGEILSLRTPAAIAANVKNTSYNLDVYSLETGCPLNNVQLYIYNDIMAKKDYGAYMIPSIIPIPARYSNEQIEEALDKIFTAHPILTMHVEERDGTPYLVKGKKPDVMKSSHNPLKMLSFLTSESSIFESLSKYMIIRIPGKCYLISLINHMIFDVTSQNNFRKALYRALEGNPLDYVDDAFLKLSAFHQQITTIPEFDEITRFMRSILDNLDNVGFLPNSGKGGKLGFMDRDLDVDQDLMKRFLDKYGVSRNIFFSAVLACALSKLTGKDDIFFGYVDIGRDKFNNYDSIGLYINTLPMTTHVRQQSLRAFLKNLSDNYYKLMRYDYYPAGPLFQEYNISPVILFQFLPDWIVADGGYGQLPLSEGMINAIVSTQKNLFVDLLIEVIQTKKGYTLELTYSGYYSRKTIKKLADTYQKALYYLLSYC